MVARPADIRRYIFIGVSSGAFTGWCVNEDGLRTGPRLTTFTLGTSTSKTLADMYGAGGVPADAVGFIFTCAQNVYYDIAGPGIDIQDAAYKAAFVAAGASNNVITAGNSISIGRVA